MPTFDTPEPISVMMDLGVGLARITASDRNDTTVEIRPSDESDQSDVRAAENTRVELRDGQLLINAPKKSKMFGKPGSIDVTIELPTSSQVLGNAAIAEFHSVGQLDKCQIKTATGNIMLGNTGTVELDTSAGDIVVDHVAGNATVRTASGNVRLGRVNGTAMINNFNGDSWGGEIIGELQVDSTNGNISIDRAGAKVSVNNADGDIRIGEVTRGPAALNTHRGEIEIGIPAGIASRLNVDARNGKVHNHLDATEDSRPSENSVDVRARSSSGDIVIRRS